MKAYWIHFQLVMQFTCCKYVCIQQGMSQKPQTFQFCISSCSLIEATKALLLRTRLAVVRNELLSYISPIACDIILLHSQGCSKKSPGLHVVMGNEACDMDSMVSALTFAYFLSKVCNVQPNKPIISAVLFLESFKLWWR